VHFSHSIDPSYQTRFLLEIESPSFPGYNNSGRKRRWGLIVTGGAIIVRCHCLQYVMMQKAWDFSGGNAKGGLA